jgi:hypothetical protein
MDYFETINSTKEAEMVYANWYAQLPDARKAQMLCNFYDLGINTVRYNARKENPFITEAEATMKYIEANLKNRITSETYAFVVAKMAERAEQEWQERFKKMKKELNWTYADIARFMEASGEDAVKSSISRKLPAFAKFAVCVFEQSKKTE